MTWDNCSHCERDAWLNADDHCDDCEWLLPQLRAEYDRGHAEGYAKAVAEIVADLRKRKHLHDWARDAADYYERGEHVAKADKP
jgi:hypothetical protein